MRPVRCLSRTRQVFIWASFVLAVGGWGFAGWMLGALGAPAGVDGFFVYALCVAIASTVVCCQSVVMPDQARIYAVGIERGMRMAREQHAPDRHLAAVK